MNGYEKPPLGLRPRFVVRQQRVREILEAIDRYNSAGKATPVEWGEELILLLAEERVAS